MKSKNGLLMTVLATVAGTELMGTFHQSAAQATSAYLQMFADSPKITPFLSSNKVLLLAVAVTILETNSGHIFRDAPGHFPKDTPENRKLLIDTASDAKNYLGSDKYGNEWYAKTRSDGTQVWARVRSGKITNGGLNQKPGTYDSQLGLTKPGD